MTNDKSHEATYSKIIDALSYNRMMSVEHLYISAADKAIRDIALQFAAHNENPTQIVEIGPGPIRLTPSLAQIPNSIVTAIDHDQGWITIAQKIVQEQNLNINFVCADIETYQHQSKIDVAVSQGSHHHIPKGESTTRYLANIRKQLSPGGIFVISDEMIPNYNSENERRVRLCIWYAHIIQHAMQCRYEDLAIAEMETLLDDLFEGTGQRANKTEEQITLLRNSIPFLANSAKYGFLKQAEILSEELLRGIQDTQAKQSGEEAPLSRGDYKICFAEFEKEVSAAGFRIRDVKTIGPIETIGGFGIYTLDVQP